MEKLILIVPIALCCAVPLLIAVGASLFGRKPAQGEDASTSFEHGRSQADGLLTENPNSMLMEDEQAGP